MKKFLDTLWDTMIAMAVIYILDASVWFYEAYWWLYDWIEEYTYIQADIVMLMVLALVAAVAIIAIDKIVMFGKRVKIHVELKPNPAKKVAKPVKA